MNHKHYTGIVLQQRPLREADIIVTLWTWEEGKVRLLVRGGKRSVSKLKAAAVPLAWVEISAVPSEHLPAVVSARIVRHYPGINRSLAKTAVVLHMFELVLQTTPDRETNHTLALALRESMDHLEESQEGEHRHILNWMMSRCIVASGHTPELSACSACGKRKHASDENRSYFSDLLAGLVCDDCRRHTVDSRLMDRAAGAYLEALFTQPHFDGEKLGRFGDDEPAAHGFLYSYLRYITERSLRSEDFLQGVALSR